jgi:hypothetical protein
MGGQSKEFPDFSRSRNVPNGETEIREGTWIKYPQGSCDDELNQTLQEHFPEIFPYNSLQSAVDTALRDSNLYVYYSNGQQNVPTFVIITASEEASEPEEIYDIIGFQIPDDYKDSNTSCENPGKIADIVLGNEFLDDLEERINILDTKLTELNASEDDRDEVRIVRRALEIARKGDENLTIDDLKFLYYLGEYPLIYFNGYREVLSQAMLLGRDKKEDLNRVFAEEDPLNGNLFIDGIKDPKGLFLPRTVRGNTDVSFRELNGTRLPEVVERSFIAEALVILEEGELPKKIGKDFVCPALEDLGNSVLQENFTGDLILSSLKISKGLDGVKKVSGNAYFSSLQELDHFTIEEIGGNCGLDSLVDIKNGELPKFVGGDFICGIKELNGKNIPRIRGDAFFNDLVDPTGVVIQAGHGDYYFDSLNPEDLKKMEISPEYFGHFHLSKGVTVKSPAIVENQRQVRIESELFEEMVEDGYPISL